MIAKGGHAVGASPQLLQMMMMVASVASRQKGNNNRRQQRHWGRRRMAAVSMTGEENKRMDGSQRTNERPEVNNWDKHDVDAAIGVVRIITDYVNPCNCRKMIILCINGIRTAQLSPINNIHPMNYLIISQGIYSFPGTLIHLFIHN